MKTKLFSGLLMIMLVFFAGSLQAEVPSDNITGIDIEQVSAEAATVADALVADHIEDIVKVTKQEVRGFLPHSIQLNTGDIDHQLITICARENATAELAGYVPYTPRSNLNYSGYEV